MSKKKTKGEWVRTILFFKDGQAEVIKVQEIWHSDVDGEYWTVPDSIEHKGRTFSTKVGVALNVYDDHGCIDFLWEEFDS